MGSPVMTSPSTSGAQGRSSMSGGDLRSNVVRLNAPRALFSDLYHRLIQMSWPAFLALLVTLYFSANLFFASVYTLLGDVSSISCITIHDMTNHG